jgi:hypothetical protein
MPQSSGNPLLCLPSGTFLAERVFCATLLGKDDRLQFLSFPDHIDLKNPLAKPSSNMAHVDPWAR